MSTTPTLERATAQNPRITNISLTDHHLAALDDKGRIWLVIALGCNPPEWRLLPLPEEPGDDAAPARSEACPACDGYSTRIPVRGSDDNTCPDCGGDGRVTEALDPEEAGRQAEQARYAIAKQLATAHTLESTYGGWNWTTSCARPSSRR